MKFCLLSTLLIAQKEAGECSCFFNDYYLIFLKSYSLNFFPDIISITFLSTSTYIAK